MIQFIESEKIKKQEFYKNVGIVSSNFKGSGAKSELGGTVIAKILTFYPDINPYWLILGVGDMKITTKSNEKLMQAAEPDEKYNLLEKRVELLEQQQKK